MQLDITFTFEILPATLEDAQGSAISDVLAPIVSSAGLLIGDMVSLPGDANCPAITTTEDDIQSDIVSDGASCAEPTLLKITPDGNKCGKYFQ